VEQFLRDSLSSSVTAARDVAALSIDGALTPEAATVDFAEQLEKAGPYGSGNPAPRFVFPAHRITFAKQAGEAHIRCSLKSGGGATIGAIAFRAMGTPLGDALLGGADRPYHIAGRIQRDSWGGRDRVEVMIEDVADPTRQAR
jgi:single-stranded-DNA-specific exonuclease